MTTQPPKRGRPRKYDLAKAEAQQAQTPAGASLLDDPYLTVTRAAELTGKGPDTIRDAIKIGDLIGRKFATRPDAPVNQQSRYLIKLSALEAWMKSLER